MKKTILKILVLICLLLSVVVNSQCFAVTKSDEQRAKELLEDMDTITIDMDDTSGGRKNTGKVEVPEVPGVTDSKNTRVNDTVENTLKYMRVAGIFAIFMIFEIGKMFIL